MTLKEPLELEPFFAAVRRCRGGVRFISDEDDVLNLKSRLCLFVFSAMEAGHDPIKGRIECDNASDYQILKGFLVNE